MVQTYMRTLLRVEHTAALTEAHWSNPAVRAALKASVANNPPSPRLQAVYALTPKLLRSFGATVLRDAPDGVLCALLPAAVRAPNPWGLPPTPNLTLTLTSARESGRARVKKGCGEVEKRGRKPAFPLRFGSFTCSQTRHIPSMFDSNASIAHKLADHFPPTRTARGM